MIYLDNNIIDYKLIGNEDNIVFYTDDEDNVNIEVLLQDENVWLNIESLTKLFKIQKRHIHFLKLFKINYISQLLERQLQN